FPLFFVNDDAWFRDGLLGPRIGPQIETDNADRNYDCESGDQSVLRLLVLFLVFLVALGSRWGLEFQERFDCSAMIFRNLDERFVAKGLEIVFAFFRLSLHQHHFANAIVIERRRRPAGSTRVNTKNLVALT